jgi:uncharacterized repeat protein (TIGR03803 family)
MLARMTKQKFRGNASMKQIVNAAVFVLWATTAIALPAQTFTTLFSFYETDGALPEAALVQATNGDFYGTTTAGGTYGSGTVFQITPSGTLTTLYTFCSQGRCADGQEPYAGLIQATNGDLYGTTGYGGANSFNAGTVFKITPSGKLTTLYSFCSQIDCTDGEYPLAALVQAANGDFYGTTSGGGAHRFGTVFKITSSGTLTTLHSFCSQIGCTDGGYSLAGLVQAFDGDLYGTTSGGGANANGSFYTGGTIFKITPSGMLTTLYSFCAQSLCTDGENPYAGLLQTADGNFYGTTYAGGANGFGTVFEIAPTGALTTLYSFDIADGENPRAGLVQATNGDLYGTTSGGGPNGGGTIFQIAATGMLTTLYNFCSQSECRDGEDPAAVLVQATDGSFYGTTAGGGTNNDGAVFSLSVGLGPFVETERIYGKVGAVVKILGTDLTGATSVSFNGTAAVFKVISSSLITTSVSVGATSGPVQVVTPGGTLASNVPFRVLP